MHISTLHRTLLCCIVEYWIILHYTELCWTTLHCTALYYVFHIWCFTKLEYCNVKSVTSLSPKLFAVRWIESSSLRPPHSILPVSSGDRPAILLQLQKNNQSMNLFKQMRFDILWVFWSWQISLLCLVREFAGEGSVVVAVGVSVSRMRDFFLLFANSTPKTNNYLIFNVSQHN